MAIDKDDPYMSSVVYLEIEEGIAYEDCSLKLFFFFLIICSFG